MVSGLYSSAAFFFFFFLPVVAALPTLTPAGGVDATAFLLFLPVLAATPTPAAPVRPLGVAGASAAPFFFAFRFESPAAIPCTSAATSAA